MKEEKKDTKEKLNLLTKLKSLRFPFSYPKKKNANEVTKDKPQIGIIGKFVLLLPDIPIIVMMVIIIVLIIQIMIETGFSLNMVCSILVICFVVYRFIYHNLYLMRTLHFKNKKGLIISFTIDKVLEKKMRIINLGKFQLLFGIFSKHVATMFNTLLQDFIMGHNNKICEECEKKLNCSIIDSAVEKKPEDKCDKMH